ncbi:hypothetical protein QW3_2071 [Clostridioides difficile P74]|nr:hypothetical protein QUY_2045 [Clostridioides difficile P71]EQK31804.1 hypothetical protein QW3_2071 [Clostridioides difficile P74]
MSMKSVLYYETKVGKVGIAEKMIILQICFFLDIWLRF